MCACADTCKRLPSQMHLGNQQQHDQHARHRHLPPHVRLIQDIVSPAVAPFVQELPGDALPTKYSFLFCFCFFFFSFSNFPFSDCHSLDHRRQERVDGNVTAVGPFKSGASREIVPSSTKFWWSRWDMRGTQTENNCAVELRHGRLGLVKEFVVWVRSFRPELRTSEVTSGSITRYVMKGTQRAVPVNDIVEGTLTLISCSFWFSSSHPRRRLKRTWCLSVPWSRPLSSLYLSLSNIHLGAEQIRKDFGFHSSSFFLLLFPLGSSATLSKQEDSPERAEEEKKRRKKQQNRTRVSEM